MSKFIKNIIAFSLKNKAFTFFWVGILVISGFIAFKNMPIEAFSGCNQYPDHHCNRMERQKCRRNRTICNDSNRNLHELRSEEN